MHPTQLQVPGWRVESTYDNPTVLNTNSNLVAAGTATVLRPTWDRRQASNHKLHTSLYEPVLDHCGQYPTAFEQILCNSLLDKSRVERQVSARARQFHQKLANKMCQRIEVAAADLICAGKTIRSAQLPHAVSRLACRENSVGCWIL